MNSEDVSLSTSFREVKQLRTPGVAIITDDGLRSLDVTTNSGQVLLKSPQGTVNAQLAVSQDGTFAIATIDGEHLYRITSNLQIHERLSIGNLKAQTPGFSPEDYSFNWSMYRSPDNEHLYVTLLPRVQQPIPGAVDPEVKQETKPSYIGKIDLGSKVTELLPAKFPESIAVDWKTDTVYVAEFERLDIANFGTASTTTLDGGWSFVDIKRDLSSLLLSSDDTGRITQMDTQTRVLEVLPVKGSYAVYGPQNSVFFRRDENTLWRWMPGTTAATMLFRANGAGRLERRGSYGTPPRLSRNGKLLSWTWAIQTARDRTENGVYTSGATLGTVLVDLEHEEYIRTPRYLHNIAWLSKSH